MVDVRATNDKLRARVRRIVELATGAPPDERRSRAREGGRRGQGRDRVAARRRSTRTPHAPGSTRPTGGYGRLVEPSETRRRSCSGRAELVPGDVEIVDGHIGALGLSSANGKGVASPGFVDLQVNGFGGSRLPRRGRRRLQRSPARRCSRPASRRTCRRSSRRPRSSSSPRWRRSPHDSERPHVLGAHLEGPFLAPERLGTHPPAARRDPDTGAARAPARGRAGAARHARARAPGAGALIDLLQRRGVTVSCGHTDADAPEANAAFDLGVQTVTHLFNAMRPFSHRDPGIAGRRALRAIDVIVQVILDGVHLAPDTAKLIWSVGGGRVALVTDSMAGAGNGDGSYSLGGLEVEIRDGVARGPDGVLAGSSLTMIEAVRNLHGLGVPLADALDAATAVPSRIIGNPRRASSPVRPPTSSSSTTTSRSTASSSGASSVALPEPSPAELPAAGRELFEFARDSRAARCASPAFSRSGGSTRRWPEAGEAPPPAVRLVGHGSSDNAAVLRRLCLRPAARVDGDARLDVAHDLLRRPRRLRAIGGRRALPVGTDAGRRRVRRPGRGSVAR